AGETIPPLKLQYRDFAEWQNSRIRRQLLEKKEAYWLRQFSGKIPVLELPTDYQRPVIQHFAGSRRAWELNENETGNLKKLLKENEATVYMVIQAIFTLLLAKLSGQEDLVTGTPTAGREHADLQQIVGMFVNTLAMRNYPSGEKTVNAYLKEVKENTLQAFENQEYQFEDLVGKISVRRDTGHNPIFDVMFSYMEIEGTGITPFGEQENNVPRNHPEEAVVNSKFDLTLEALVSGGKLNFSIEYCVKLFKKKTIQRFTHYLKNIVTWILDNPETTIMEIDILPEEEKKRLTIQFNSTVADYPGDKTIHRIFEQQVEKAPDRIVAAGLGETPVSEPGSTAQNRSSTQTFVHLTYRELDERAGHLASLMQENGFTPGDIAVLTVPPSVETVIAILAIWKVGGSYLPVQLTFPLERIRYMLADSNARILLCANPESLPTEQETQLYKLKENIEVIELTHEQIDRYRQSTPLIPLLPHTPGTQSHHNAYLIYTSGTTGKPRGVIVPHSSFVNRLYWLQKNYNFRNNDVFIQKTPLTFDVSVCELFRCIPGGGKVILMKAGDEKDPEIMLDTVAKFNATTIDFVPSMLNLFLDYIENNNALAAVSTLRWVFVGVEALNLALARRFNRNIYKHFETRLINAYGPTEATIDITWFDCSNLEDSPLETMDGVPIGRPIQNTQIYIL
ncbi:MAG: AMP-binding protein, partial [bacterium]|nr:AMP-binding protein [bacterium]